MKTTVEDQLLLDAYERASRGAELLDEFEPGWRDAISLKTLDIRKCDDCVISQVLGGPYDQLLYDLLEDDEDPGFFGFDVMGDDPKDLGDSRDGDPCPEYDALNAAWRLIVAGLPL